MAAKTVLLRRDDVAQLVRLVGLDGLMDQMIQRLEAALREAPPWSSDLPPRSGFSYSKPQRGLLEWMPYMSGDGTATVKIVSYTPSNPRRHELPTIIGNIASYDLETGHLLALADGVFLTALRTGAASAVASRILSHPQSRVLGIIGAGAQAVTQAHALSRAFEIDRVLVYDVDRGHAESFRNRVSFLSADVRACPRDVVEAEADILSTATSVAVREGPVIDGGHLRDHVHINAIGSDMPGKFELPLHLLRTSLVCPDFVQQARVEGECQQLESWTGPDLRTLVQHAEQYVDWRHRRTVFDSTGFAFEDHVALAMLVELAQVHHVGLDVEIESISADALNPYDLVPL